MELSSMSLEAFIDEIKEYHRIIFSMGFSKIVLTYDTIGFCITKENFKQLYTNLHGQSFEVYRDHDKFTHNDITWYNMTDDHKLEDEEVTINMANKLEEIIKNLSSNKSYFNDMTVIVSITNTVIQIIISCPNQIIDYVKYIFKHSLGGDLYDNALEYKEGNLMWVIHFRPT